MPEEFPRDHILYEPEKRDTFPAFTSHAAIIANRTSWDEPQLFMQSDHIIEDRESQLVFNQTLIKIAQTLIDPESTFDVIALAVKPLYPSTQYGYFELTEPDLVNSFTEVVPVKRFKEKPNYETAEHFIQTGRFLWNVSPSCFTFRRLMQNVQIHQPSATPILNEFAESGLIKPELFAKLPKTSFDFGLVEKLEKIGVMGMRISWEDIGNWEVVKNYLTFLGSEGPHFEVGGINNAVKLADNSRKVAFVGVSNLLLVDSPEGILVIDPRFSSEIKKVAEYFEKL